MFKYLHLPFHLHLKVSQFTWPKELLLTHHLQCPDCLSSSMITLPVNMKITIYEKYS